MAPKNTTGTLSDRDRDAVVAAFKHNKNAVEIDFEAYAAELGLANAASGRTYWFNLRKKLNMAGEAKKQTVEENAEESGVGDQDEAPVKKKKKAKKAEKAEKAEKNAGDSKSGKKRKTDEVSDAGTEGASNSPVKKTNKKAKKVKEEASDTDR